MTDIDGDLMREGNGERRKEINRQTDIETKEERMKEREKKTMKTKADRYKER